MWLATDLNMALREKPDNTGHWFLEMGNRKSCSTLW